MKNNFRRYLILNKSLEDVAKSINVLEKVEVKPQVIEHVRLTPNPYVVSEATKRNASVVTAHNLLQYKAKAFAVILQEEIPTWLDALLQIDEEMEAYL